MLAFLLEILQKGNSTVSVTIDWGIITVALAPVITIIVTWYLKRRSDKTAVDQAAKDVKDVKNSVAELADRHEADKQEAMEKREQDTQAIIAGQQTIAAVVNGKSKAASLPITQVGGDTPITFRGVVTVDPSEEK